MIYCDDGQASKNRVSKTPSSVRRDPVVGVARQKGGPFLAPKHLPRGTSLQSAIRNSLSSQRVLHFFAAAAAAAAAGRRPLAAMADGHRFYQIEFEMPLVTAYIESSIERPTLESNHFYQLSIESNIEKPTLVLNQLVSISSDNDYFRGKFEDGSECEQFRFANMQQQPAKHTSVSTTTVQYE